jgi:hypothetical protein
MNDLEFEIDTDEDTNDAATFHKKELAWAKKQIECERFERKLRRQRNDLVWVVHIGKVFKVTQRGQLRYDKDRDFFTSRAAAVEEANKRLVVRLAKEDEANPTNTWIREVLFRDAKSE